jgi:putative ABC transport system substrate-binding protein
MKRRAFTALIGGAVVWPLAARAQQAMPVIGFLGSTSPQGSEGRLTALRQGLGDTGFVEGRNIAIEFRWADSQYDRMPALAADLIQRRAAVIVAYGAVNAALSAKAATTEIPIVFLNGSDPVKFGLVASLNRPGGNVTGVTLLVRQLTAKRLEIIREIIPGIATIGLLANPNNANTNDEVRELQEAARSLGVQLRVLHASNQGEIDAAFASAGQQQVGAFLAAGDVLFTSQRDQIVALAARHKIPGIANSRDYAEAGGLVSYGADQLDAFRLTGRFAGRILKGEKPADLPVQQSTKVELVVNLKTAKALGISVPLPLLGRADGVIE